MSSVFFFNDTATTEIYTLSLHDALPICPATNGSLMAVRMPVFYRRRRCRVAPPGGHELGEDRERDLLRRAGADVEAGGDRKSTRLNSSHANISDAGFCL